MPEKDAKLIILCKISRNFRFIIIIMIRTLECKPVKLLEQG